MEELQKELKFWYKMDSDMKYQNSRENLIKKESKNTKYLHSKENYRRRRNHIDSLKDELGIRHSDGRNVEQLQNKHVSTITST